MNGTTIGGAVRFIWTISCVDKASVGSILAIGSGTWDPSAGTSEAVSVGRAGAGMDGASVSFRVRQFGSRSTSRWNGIPSLGGDGRTGRFDGPGKAGGIS